MRFCFLKDMLWRRSWAGVSLTFQSLGQWPLCTCRRRHSAVGEAEAGRSHTVRSILQQSIQQPETVWGTSKTQKHKQEVPGVWKQIRHERFHLFVCDCRQCSLSLHTELSDLPPLKGFGTVPGWEFPRPQQSPASILPDLHSHTHTAVFFFFFLFLSNTQIKMLVWLYVAARQLPATQSCLTVFKL